jgi:ABC-type phosphate transport system substrate-binding protein
MKENAPTLALILALNGAVGFWCASSPLRRSLLRRILLPFASATSLLLLVDGAADAADAFKVVVHSSRTLTTATKAQLSDIFLGHTTLWADDGSRILPVDQVETSPLRQDFSRRVHKRAASAVRSYWLQLMYSGRGVPPIEKATDDEVIAYVASHPGAVGYVTSSKSTDSVKVLRVDP